MTAPNIDTIPVPLSSSEFRMIITACAACAESGGGSPMWSLVRKLITATGIDPEPEHVLYLQTIAMRELKTCMN